MSDLANLMRSLDTAVAETMSERQEFRGAEATRVVKRRRVVRTTAVVALAVLATASIGGGATALWWDISNPPVSLPVVTITATPSPSPSPSPTASPSPSPSIDPTVDAACPSRADYLSAEEAKRIAESPTTGEVWLDEPVPVAAPSPELENFGDWVRIGYRGDNEILIVAYRDFSVLEVSPDGSIEWILRPGPSTQPTYAWIHEPEGVGKNYSQCYESLAFPSQFTLPSGLLVDAPSPLMISRPLNMTETTETVIDSFGENQLIRIDGQWQGNYPYTQIPQPSYATYFVLRTAAGVDFQIPFKPLTGADTLTGFEVMDFYDAYCSFTEAPELWDGASSDDQWRAIGQLRGRDVGVPEANNLMAIDRYNTYIAVKGESGIPLDSYEQFLANYGVVGLRDDDGGWWVGIKPIYSPREGC